jgi:peptidoglycan DL-endopeptidase CwlO
VRRGLISVAIFAAFVAIFTLSRHAIHSTTTTTTTTAKIATTTSSTTSTTLASANCVASDFSGAYNEGEGAAGTVYASVTLTKTTAGTCTLQGWPILTLQNRLGGLLKSVGVDVPSSSSGFQFSTPAQANAAPTSVTLTSGGTTTFSLAYSDVQSGTTACESAVTISVQFVSGGATVPVTPTYPVQPCNSGQIWLSPFY